MLGKISKKITKDEPSAMEQGSPVGWIILLSTLIVVSFFLMEGGVKYFGGKVTGDEPVAEVVEN